MREQCTCRVRMKINPDAVKWRGGDIQERQQRSDRTKQDIRSETHASRPVSRRRSRAHAPGSLPAAPLGFHSSQALRLLQKLCTTIEAEFSGAVMTNSMLVLCSKWPLEPPKHRRTWEARRSPRRRRSAEIPIATAAGPLSAQIPVRTRTMARFSCRDAYVYSSSAREALIKTQKTAHTIFGILSHRSLWHTEPVRQNDSSASIQLE